MLVGTSPPRRPGRVPLAARPVVPPRPGEAPRAPRAPGAPGASTGASTGTGSIRTERAGVPRHCWVIDEELTPGRCPGLLLEWDRTPHGWRGRVVFTLPGDGGPVLMEAWLPSGLLRPADPV
ncbi:MAG: hypothetical protein QG622_3526 [Actinomycetota bacterium]|nr:hypothetical protein [Actinomycetota bacterium]